MTNSSLPNNDDNNIPKGHKRQQASIGLGIVTHLTKPDLNQPSPPPPKQQHQRRESISRNNAFFDTSSTSLQMKPPPKLIRTLSVKDYSHKNNAATPAKSMMFQHRIVENTQQQPQDNPPTFADRIRGIVLAKRNSAILTPATSLQSTIEQSDSICSIESTSSSDSSTYSSDVSMQLFPEENIIPLPSPAQHNTTNRHYSVMTPILLPEPATSTAADNNNNPIFATTTKNTMAMMMDQDPPTSAIPLISLSPNFSPNKTNIIPSLLEVPMLGDMEHLDIPREHSFSSPPSATVQEDNLIGKHIWKFRIKQLLGVGAFSKVYLADNIEENNGERFACKMINKDRLREDSRVRSSIEREVGVLKFLDHDHIVQLEATMETEQHVCIVLEYVQGEELFEFVQRMHIDIHKENSNLSIDEKLIKRLTLELIQVVSWLHDHNIVHRDLKLENILVYLDSQGEIHLKLTDFGLARVVDPNEPTLTTRCGSEEYAAPEIVQSVGYDGRLTDTWSIGIILYAMLVGYLPFTYNQSKGEKLSHLFHRIVMAQVKWPSKDNISPDAKNVVESILVRKPEKRIRLDQLEKLAWFADN